MDPVTAIANAVNTFLQYQLAIFNALDDATKRAQAQQLYDAGQKFLDIFKELGEQVKK
jgi:hypothetical protein